MSVAISVLCPIDFSDPSRSALRYGIAIANHFGARLTLLAVDDPLLVEAAASVGVVPSLTEETMQELRRLGADVLGKPYSQNTNIDFLVRTGKPAVEILRETRKIAADLIVMSSRGHTGVRKMFFGSTTERVLRETTVPVLVTPTEPPQGQSLDEIARYVNRIIAPVDLSEASSRQLAVAAGIAQALSVPLLIAHVLEPLVIPTRVRLAMSGTDEVRRASAEDKLADVAQSLPETVKTEALVVSGDPAEEIVKLTEARHAKLIVMGLHSAMLFGSRMGSVTYRVLSLTHTLVLALPPKTPSVD
jgi:nucleotide-binding universal stress UspA family protein